MRPIAPRTGAAEITVAEEQAEYMPLTVAVYPYADGYVGLLTRWTLSAEEREAVANGADIYAMQLTCGNLQPMIVRVNPGDFAI